jgi:hypothetical protein
MQIADTMVSTGLRDAGYEYVNIDDCCLFFFLFFHLIKKGNGASLKENPMDDA